MSFESLHGRTTPRPAELSSSIAHFLGVLDNAPKRILLNFSVRKISSDGFHPGARPMSPATDQNADGSLNVCGLRRLFWFFPTRFCAGWTLREHLPTWVHCCPGSTRPSTPRRSRRNLVPSASVFLGPQGLRKLTVSPLPLLCQTSPPWARLFLNHGIAALLINLEIRDSHL